MRLIVQRVKKAKVTRVEDGEVTGEIEKGFFVLIGVKKGDSKKEVDVLAEKLSKLRVMRDSHGKMNLSIKDVDGEILFVSQFTLHGDTTGGNRPSFINAEDPEKAEELYLYFIEKLKSYGITVETGSFGDEMQIDASLDGPVTIIYSD